MIIQIQFQLLLIFYISQFRQRKTQWTILTCRYTTPELQFDQEGYVKSFDVDKASNQQLQKFYHKYGFIIFSNVISQQEIQRTIDDLWNSTISYYKLIKKQIKRDDKETWGLLRGFQKKFGFVGDNILQQPQIWKNRKNPNIYKSFKRSYQAYLRKPLTQPLISNFDRGSLMLPSKLNPDWQSSNIYHFDIDPWAWTNLSPNTNTKYDYDPDRMSMLLGQGNYDPYVGYTKLAGVLALSDTNEESGGFECPCGFQNYIKKWCELHKQYIRIQKDQNLLKCFKKIFMKKGSLMIFSRELPHNIYKNKSTNFRYAQYLRMSPLSALCLDQQLMQNRKKLVKMILPKDLDVSDPISRQIFMLDQDHSANNGKIQNTENQKTDKKHENNKNYKCSNF